MIAAVNGPAIGAGCDLACMCDIRIAGESAIFAESFVKVGLIPGDGGAWLLQRIVGCQSARKVDPGSASNIDRLVVRDGERPTGWSWSGLRSPVGRVGEAFRL